MKPRNLCSFSECQNLNLNDGIVLLRKTFSTYWTYYLAPEHTNLWMGRIECLFNVNPFSRPLTIYHGCTTTSTAVYDASSVISQYTQKSGSNKDWNLETRRRIANAKFQMTSLPNKHSLRGNYQLPLVEQCICPSSYDPSTGLTIYWVHRTLPGYVLSSCAEHSHHCNIKNSGAEFRNIATEQPAENLGLSVNSGMWSVARARLCSNYKNGVSALAGLTHTSRHILLYYYLHTKCVSSSLLHYLQLPFMRFLPHCPWRNGMIMACKMIHAPSAGPFNISRVL